MDEILREFLVESREALDQLDRDFRDLDGTRDPETLARAFRRIHTIKGNCGFFGFDRLEQRTHRGEGLLVRLRDGEAGFDAVRMAELRSLADAIRADLTHIDRTGQEAAGDPLPGAAGNPPPEGARAAPRPAARLGARLARVAQDVAHRCGRKVALEFQAIDWRALETIRDPITHLVRNAVDHGIESPADRVRAGKPEEGRILLRTWRENGAAGFEMIDDGAGIDPARIRTKARELGLRSSTELSDLTDEDVLQLVFHPGLSTGEAASLISGRGVGMDVVRTDIEAAGGTVDVRSAIGVGTTVRIRIPLSRAGEDPAHALPDRAGG